MPDHTATEATQSRQCTYPDELTYARAQRDAALRLAQIWDDAPDPACRAMAADLRSAISGARPSPTPAPEQQLARVRAERDQLQLAVDKVRGLNQLTINASCRVQAVHQAEDTLRVLDDVLGHANPGAQL